MLEGDLALLLGEAAAPLSVVRAGPGQGEQKMVFLTSWRMKHRQEFFGPLLPANAVVFDIGANHGEYTAAFLSVGARRVVAIEPQSTAANFIIEAFPNEIQSGALIVRTHAIGASKGAGRLFPANDPGMSMSTLSKQFVDVSVRNGRQWDQEKSYEVEINTLDCLIEEIGIPDYVKIDVEGYDFEVLSGLSRPIPLLSFEFNTNPGLIEIAEKCTSYIGKLGGYEFNYQAEASGETAVQFTKWVSPSVMLYTLRHDLARKEMFGDIFARLKSL